MRTSEEKQNFMSQEQKIKNKFKIVNRRIRFIIQNTYDIALPTNGANTFIHDLLNLSLPTAKRACKRSFEKQLTAVLSNFPQLDLFLCVESCEHLFIAYLSLRSDSQSTNEIRFFYCCKNLKCGLVWIRLELTFRCCPKILQIQNKLTHDTCNNRKIRENPWKEI